MKLIYITVEVKNRELINKLFFIANNINKNFAFFIGDKLAVKRATSFLGQGIYFYKSINYNDTDHILRIKNKGNAYVSLDEEGGATLDNRLLFQSFLEYRSSEKNVSLVDKILTWGDFDHKEWSKKYSKHKSKIIKTGSTRFDVWRNDIYPKIFKDEIEDLKKNGKFFFIPSSFYSSYNDLKEAINKDKKLHNIQATINLKKRIEAKKNNYKTFLKFVQIIKRLSKDFPNHKILIKPHPTENLDNWKKKFNKKEYPNILYDNRFDLTSYIAASSCVIFNSSTAGMQSIIMGKKVFSYNLKKNKTFRNFPNYCTPQVNDYQELKKKINKNFRKDKIKYLKKIKKRFYIDKETSSKIIMKNLKKIRISRNKNIKSFKIKFLGRLYQSIDNLFFILSKFKKIFFKKKSGYQGYSRKMPNGIRYNEITKIFKNLNLQKKVKIINFGKNGYLILKNDE